MAGVFSKLQPNFHNVVRSSLSNGSAYKTSASCYGVTGLGHKTVLHTSEDTRSYVSNACSHPDLTVDRRADTNRENRFRTLSADTTNRDRSGRMNNDNSNRNQVDNVGTESDRSTTQRDLSDPRNTSRDRGNSDRNQMDSVNTRNESNSSTTHNADSTNTSRGRGNINRNQTDSVNTRSESNSSNRHLGDSAAARNAESDRGSTSTIDNDEKSKQAFGNSFGIVLNNPKYRQYATQDSRLKSYGKWPKNKKVSVNTLISAGFAYTGVDDSVRCFYCGGALRDWPDDADPWREHALKFPDCGHLRQCKGDAYIKHVRDEDESDCEIDGDGDDVIDRVEVAMKRNKDAVMAARDFCNDETLLKCGIKRLLLRNDTFSAVDLIKVTEEIKEDDESDKIAEATSLDMKECSESETESENELDILEENRKLKDPVTCKICFDAFACIITLPCGHMVSCSQCISALSKCAVCRADIKGTVRALMAV